MKLIIKQFFFYLMLLGYLNSNAQNTDCPVFLLANDLSSSIAEFKAVVNESKGFDAWRLLNKEKPTLRTNIEELTLVSKNLDDITNAGGYLKWKTLQGAGNRVARSIEQIAPNGIIPSNSQTNNLFHKWFDDLIPEELDLVLGNPSLKEALEARIRYPGGLHEWCMVCEIKTFKSWEISMSEIHRFRTKTLDLTGINPTTGANFVHGGAGSTAFHNELRTMIQSSTSLTDFNTKLAQLVNRWQIDPSLLPPLIK